MDKGRFLVETHLRTKQPIQELAEAHGMSESWLYKLLARYRVEGPAGLESRSRRPKTSPSRIADLYEDEIVRVRKELSERGFDAGAQTIHAHMLSFITWRPRQEPVQSSDSSSGYISALTWADPVCTQRLFRRCSRCVARLVPWLPSAPNSAQRSATP